jgi:heptosyltransferase-2
MQLTKQQKFTHRYRFQTILFKAIDSLLWPLSLFVRAPTSALPDPQNILIANAGHLGDLVITTGVIAAIQEQWPRAKIGLLCARSIKPLENHFVGISAFHYLDHWYTNRAPQSRWQKIVNYYRHSKAVVQEINAQHYDVAVDLRVWFPNFVPLLWRTNIPIRVGSKRLGFSTLLTHTVPFEFEDSHESAYQLVIVKKLIPSVDTSQVARSVLKDGLPQADLSLIQWLATHNILPRTPYRIMHMGSSNALRDWPIARWQELASQLEAQGHQLIFTGAGELEWRNIEKVIAHLPKAINACDALNLSQLIGLLGGAELVYSVETSVGHIAAAIGVPVVALYGGTADPDQWRPLGKVSLVTERLTCAPCYLQKGCQSMACIRGIEVAQVQKAAAEVLAITRTS